MGFTSDEMELPALGRAAFLGQLYNASSEHFVNLQLFDKSIVENKQIVLNPSNNIEYHDIKTISDRTNALDINAELSIGILSGMIELKGSGQYLDTNKSNVATREVSMICLTRKQVERLQLGVNDVISLRAYNRAVKAGATHVVTAITYGGTLITNIVEKTSSSETQTKIHGEFSASVMKKMASKFSLEGKASVDSDVNSKDITESCDFKCYGDYAISSQDNPTTVGDMFELAKKWPSLIGDGVPVQITVTPLDQFVDDSVEAKLLHELEADQLYDILTAYDIIYRFAARRSRILAALETGPGRLSDCCPTFMETCRKRKNTSDGILGRSRKALAQYLVKFRDGGEQGAGETTGDFLNGVKEGLENHLKDCTEDESMLGLLGSIQALSENCKAPFATINELPTLMTQANRRMLGVVLIPPSPNLNGAINTYDALVVNIQRWREEEDKKALEKGGNAQDTMFVSFYCDETLTADLLKLDGKKGVLRKALNGFSQAGDKPAYLAQSNDPRFVYYGALPTLLLQTQQFDWSQVNEDGWAFLYNEKESYHYVGQVLGGKRHGRGTITYADGSTYTGDWWMDRRHGEGVFIKKSERTSGIFVNDQYYSDGIVTDLTIYANRVPIGAAKVPLRRRDSATAHVRMIGTMLGWTDTDEYKVIVECAGDPSEETLEIIVIGTLIKAGQDKMYTKSWPLERGIELKAEKRK
ncbi:hypothetical protein GYMLUDRAFT_49211 [Collybiopsis luxurians FD-317 M1]|uniref:SNTX MACPF/CDC-like domain-containing protein n=1 Tax=Collybiopsis luxurians FD-317 M1 TaxID=944289 RepID=A0A0D0C796_9AGAR|nr:hypothetical protein GYMLUDRAFT_49211 [Collybiopsis luxurians FD-317 M1]